MCAIPTTGFVPRQVLVDSANLAIAERANITLHTKQSILLFALDITEKGLGWSQQKRPHAPPGIANYLILSVVI